MVSYDTFDSIYEHIFRANSGIGALANILSEIESLNEDGLLPDYLKFLDTGYMRGSLHNCILELSDVLAVQSDRLDELKRVRVEECLYHKSHKIVTGNGNA